MDTTTSARRYDTAQEQMTIQDAGMTTTKRNNGDDVEATVLEVIPDGNAVANTAEAIRRDPPPSFEYPVSVVQVDDDVKKKKNETATTNGRNRNSESGVEEFPSNTNNISNNRINGRVRLINDMHWEGAEAAPSDGSYLSRLSSFHIFGGGATYDCFISVGVLVAAFGGIYLVIHLSQEKEGDEEG